MAPSTAMLAATPRRAPFALPLRALWLVVAVLAALDGIGRLTYWGRHRLADTWLGLFNSTMEWTVPTVVSALMMGAVGACCWRRWREGPCFAITGTLFVYLCVDDLFGFHEAIGAAVYPYLGGQGVYVWMFTVAPVFALVGAVCAWRLWVSLPKRRSRVLLIGGFAALAIALAFEFAEARAAASSLRPRGVPLIAYAQWCEETLELVGPLLLLTAVWPRRVPPRLSSRVGDPVVFVGAGR